MSVLLVESVSEVFWACTQSMRAQSSKNIHFLVMMDVPALRREGGWSTSAAKSCVNSKLPPKTTPS